MTKKTKVIIMGAAGRDFHNFNVYFRDNPAYEVVAFTATQIPKISGRVYPAELAGPLYPKGIPIKSEDKLLDLIAEKKPEQVVFAYSDISHEYVMHKASAVLAAGADFRLMGSDSTMLKSKLPVISVCAVRTGCGKSQTTRKIVNILRGHGRKVAIVRHPMPYGNLVRQKAQRFEKIEDMDAHECTIEEREEYEHHIRNGSVVFAGVDYAEILAAAEKEAGIILWDGGNNDLPFYEPDLEIVVADPHRPDHSLRYHPGETNLRRADVVIINKVDTATEEQVEKVRADVRFANPNAVVVEAASPVSVDNPQAVKGKRALIIEDGPTLTHGGMSFGAGTIAARKLGAAEIVDPRPYASGEIAEVFRKYPNIGALLPAVGYGREQIEELNRTISKTPADLVIVGTPIDLRLVLRIDKPAVRVTYSLQEIGRPNLDELIEEFLNERK